MTTDHAIAPYAASVPRLGLGVQTRWVAVPQPPIPLGALTVHAGNGWGFTNPGGGWEYVAMWITAQVALILLGDGPLALWRSFRVPFVGAGRAVA